MDIQDPEEQRLEGEPVEPAEGVIETSDQPVLTDSEASETEEKPASVSSPEEIAETDSDKEKGGEKKPEEIGKKEKEDKKAKKDDTEAPAVEEDKTKEVEKKEKEDKKAKKDVAKKPAVEEDKTKEVKKKEKEDKKAKKDIAKEPAVEEDKVKEVEKKKEDKKAKSSTKAKKEDATPEEEEESEQESASVPSSKEIVETETVEDEPAIEPEPVSETEPEAESKQEQDDDPSDWFVIHCYSGYENKVRHNLEQRIETMGMKDMIFDVVVPTQEEVEVRDGKRRTVERHIFPGYVLVNLILTEESWYVVRNTPGVTGFVGMGNNPTPLRADEVSQIVKRMEADAPMVKVTFKVGERVRIIDGPFNDFRGMVAEIDMERTKVRVMVSFFGRETPVELDFLQVEKA